MRLWGYGSKVLLHQMRCTNHSALPSTPQEREACKTEQNATNLPTFRTVCFGCDSKSVCHDIVDVRCGEFGRHRTRELTTRVWRLSSVRGDPRWRPGIRMRGGLEGDPRAWVWLCSELERRVVLLLQLLPSWQHARKLPAKCLSQTVNDNFSCENKRNKHCTVFTVITL